MIRWSAWLRPLAVAFTLISTVPSASFGQSAGRLSPLDAVELLPLANGVSVSLVARIDSPGPVTHFLLENPLRLVVDIAGAEHRLERFDFPDLRLGPVLGVRTSQFRAGTVRLVLDLADSPTYTVSANGAGVRVELDGPNTNGETPLVPLRQRARERGSRRGAEEGARASEDETIGRDPALSVPLPPEGPVLAVVTEIAGSTFYVDVGTRHGLFDRDTVHVSRASDPTRDGRLGALMVLSSASRQALLAFAGPAFAITLGDSLALEPQRRPDPVRGAAGTATGTAATAASGGAGQQGGGSTASDRDQSEQVLAVTLPASVHGRIHVSMNAQSSTTRWRGTAESLQRAFVTPTTRLRLEASDLPGGLRLTANLRGSYRHEGSNLVDPTGSFRVYELSAEKRFEGAPVRLQAGRFFSPYEAFTGYFDGALLRIGGDGFGVGGAIGLEPDRWNEGFSTARPKRSAFVDFRASGGGRGFSGEVAAVQVKPDDGAPEHLYYGWAGQAWIGDLNVAHTMQVDRDPGTSRWVVSDLLTQATLPVAGPLRLHGSWSRRSPFYFWRTAAPISFRRDDIGGGLSLDLAGASFSGDVSLHQAEGDSTWSRSYAGSMRLVSVGGSKFGLHGSGSYWDDTLLRMLSLSAGLDRSWGRSFGRVGYRLIDSSNAWFELSSHQVEALIDFPVQPGVRASALGHVRFGEGLRSYRMQLGFWRSF